MGMQEEARLQGAECRTTSSGRRWANNKSKFVGSNYGCNYCLVGRRITLRGLGVAAVVTCESATQV